MEVQVWCWFLHVITPDVLEAFLAMLPCHQSSTIKSVTETFSNLKGMIPKTTKNPSWLPDLEVKICVALHGAETRHSPGQEGEPVRQMTAVNTNVENDLDGAFGRVLEMADPKWSQGEIQKAVNRDFKIEDSKWADGKHEFNRQR